MEVLYRQAGLELQHVMAVLLATHHRLVLRKRMFARVQSWQSAGTPALMKGVRLSPATWKPAFGHQHSRPLQL